MSITIPSEQKKWRSIMFDNSFIEPLNVLLIDDDTVDILQIKRAMKKLDLSDHLHIAHNGIEALDLLRGKDGPPLKPHLVLVDLNMPRMSGLEFLEEIRQDPNLKSLTVYVVTTSSLERDQEAAHNLGVFGYLVKPITLTKLVRALNSPNSRKH